MNKVLVTDCWTRKALSIVRALGKEGLQVHTISHTHVAPPVYSSFSYKHYILPAAKEKPDAFIEKLINIIKTYKFDCIIPLEESTIEVLYKSYDKIQTYCKLSLPSKLSYETANDKWEALSLARSIDIPVPESILPGEYDSVKMLAEKLDYPVIIKPRRSSGSRGIIKAVNAAEFIKHYTIVKHKYDIPVIQEYLPRQGQGLGVACLAEDGITKVCFSYKRLREYPVTGGPGTLNESTDNTLIKEYAKRLMQKLNWTGVAMIEFKIDERSGLPKFLEINPRFWGSVQLSIASGINFPYLLYLQTTGRPVEEQIYKSGIRNRWLIPGDIMHFIKNPDRFSMKPSFFSFNDKNTYYSQFDKKDMKGNVAVVVCNLLSLFSFKRWKEGVFRK